MPMPREFQHASKDFDALIEDARDRADLATRHQTWTMIDRVPRVFRRRLTVAEGLRFAAVLPAVRPHHDFAPETAIAAVAGALRRQVDPIASERVLDGLPVVARAFWAAED